MLIQSATRMPGTADPCTAVSSKADGENGEDGDGILASLTVLANKVI